MPKENNFFEIISNESGYRLEENKLEQLFGNTIDREVTVIAVSGQSKSGNLYVVKLILKILFELYNGTWLTDTENSKLTSDSFNLDSKSEQPEFGLMISRPFVLRNKSGKECVFFLVDSHYCLQNSLIDNFWLLSHCLCVSLSSILIQIMPHNMNNEFSQSIQLIFHIANAFDTFPKGDGAKSKPFKKLILLNETTNEMECSNYDIVDGQKSICNILQNKATVNLKYNIFEKFVSFLTPVTLGNKQSCVTNNFDKEHGELFKALFLSLFESNFNLSENQETKKVRQCLEHMKSFIPVLQKVKRDSQLQDNEAFLFDFSMEDYVNKYNEIASNTLFCARKQLISFHNTFTLNTLNIGLFNEENLKNEAVIKLKILDTIEALIIAYTKVFESNEVKRISIMALKFEEIYNTFLESLNTFEKTPIIKSSESEVVLAASVDKALSEFKKYYGMEEEDIFENDYKKLIKFIEGEKGLFKKRIERKLMDQDLNQTAVNLAISHYEANVQSLFRTYPYLTKRKFDEEKLTFEKEAKEIFLDNCVHGSKETQQVFLEKYVQKQHDKDTNVKLKIEENKKITTDQTNCEFGKAIESYNKTMETNLLSFPDDEKLSLFHNVACNVAKDSFISNCTNKNSDFLSKYIEDLKIKLEVHFINHKQTLQNKIQKIKNDYSNEVLKSKNSYIQEIKSQMTQKIFIDYKEFMALHNIVHEKIIMDFNEKASEKIIFPNYQSELSSMLTEEYSRLFNENMENIKIKLKNECSRLIKAYEDHMYNAVKIVETEQEFYVEHKKIKSELIKELKILNLFQNEALLQPYIDRLKEKIKPITLSLSKLLNEQLLNRQTEKKHMLTESRNIYNNEMNELLSSSSFISKENLEEHHHKIVETVVSFFASRKPNYTKDQLHRVITPILETSFARITEENNKNTPTIPAIGIDLGTTNTVVAYYRPGTQIVNEIIIENEGKKLTPSVVAFTDNGELIGAPAKKNVDSRYKITSIKRIIGLRFNDPLVQKDIQRFDYEVINDGNNKPIVVAVSKKEEKHIYPEEVSALILAEMKKVADQYFNVEIKNVVITVPAYFNDSQKRATKVAGEHAGFNVLGIITEPEAAALAFKLKNSDKDKRNVVVYDFGGGTFDVAVLVINGNSIEFKAIDGDTHLGGDDIDNNLLNHCLKQYSGDEKETKKGGARHRLKNECEKRKKQLSNVNVPSVTIKIDNFGSKSLRVELTKNDFDKINSTIFLRTIDLVKEALVKANMNTNSVDDVILVGGSTRILKVRELLRQLFPKSKINHDVNADEAVALGASIQAAILNGVKAQQLGLLKVLNIAPMSLGVKVEGGYLSKIIEQNSRIPVKKTKEFVTVRDNQKEVEIIVYEGEEEIAIDNHELGKFTLCDLPIGKAGEIIIDVVFDIKDDGILFVNARLQNSDNSKEIQIKDHRGLLTNESLQKIIANRV